MLEPPPPRIALGVVVVILLPVPLIINIIIGEVSWSGSVMHLADWFAEAVRLQLSNELENPV